MNVESLRIRIDPRSGRLQINFIGFFNSLLATLDIYLALFSQKE